MDKQNPPQEWTFETPIGDILKDIYVFSDDLLANPPRLIRLYAERVQANWMKSTLTDGQESTTLEMTFSARPIKEGAIKPNMPPQDVSAFSTR